MEPYFSFSHEFMDSSLKEEKEKKVPRSVFHCKNLEEFLQFYLELHGLERDNVMVKVGLDGGGGVSESLHQYLGD